MGTQITVPFILLPAAVIVAVDFLFFRNEFWERLGANVQTPVNRPLARDQIARSGFGAHNVARDSLLP